MAISVAQLAEALGLEYRGDGTRPLARVATLEEAGGDSLSFATGARYRKALRATAAAAVIVPAELADEAPCALLLAEDAHRAYARAAALLHPPRAARPGVHPSAAVEPTALLGEGIEIAAQAVVEGGAVLGDGAVIGAGCFVGAGSEIGAGTRLHPRVCVYHDCRIGRDCLIQSGAVIGSDGFGYAAGEDGWLHVPQVGRVLIGDGVEIGANSTVDRGAIGDTLIGDGVIIDNQVHVAHNVRIGEHTAIAGCVGIAGSAVIGARCTIAGAAVVLGHLELVDGVHITAMSLVSHSIRQPGRYSSGTPLEENRNWRRNSVRFKQLDQLARRLGLLEKRRQ